MKVQQLSMSLTKQEINNGELNNLCSKYFSGDPEKEFARNFNGFYNIELRDMENDRETWFVREVVTGEELELGDYNYRDRPSYMDYSSKYEVLVYVRSYWSYKRGSDYFLNVVYRRNIHEAYISHDSFAKVTIDAKGENLIVYKKDISLSIISLEVLVSCLNRNGALINGFEYICSSTLNRKKEAENKNEESKINYRLNYPEEIMDD